ncbi:integrin alpha-4-like [Octopus sinensis]|uniref:Integrin alpha-4-like n=1 Tax=Octopus sinensis TaxID=2607531 RepID=A0A6P7TWU0_9MOLL|nr:integrin alpha-4-like [Octopus sinensis]
MDKHNDVLVGAPYENDGIGCIYLFNSDGKLLKKTPSQRIEGTKINNNIRSFGISFSRTVDIDKNGYPDIAVGAYLSDRAVILQSRPVIKPHKSLVVTPKILQSFLDPIWQTNGDIIVNVTLYMFFSGGNYDLVMNTNLKVDIGEPARRKRVYLENNQKEYTSSEKIKTSFYGKVYQIYVKNKINSLKPIKFVLDYHLQNNGYGTWCNLCPLLKNGSLNATVSIFL